MKGLAPPQPLLAPRGPGRGRGHGQLAHCTRQMTCGSGTNATSLNVFAFNLVFILHLPFFFKKVCLFIYFLVAFGLG